MKWKSGFPHCTVSRDIANCATRRRCSLESHQFKCHACIWKTLQEDRSVMTFKGNGMPVPPFQHLSFNNPRDSLLCSKLTPRVSLGTEGLKWKKLMIRKLHVQSVMICNFTRTQTAAVQVCQRFGEKYWRSVTSVITDMVSKVIGLSCQCLKRKIYGRWNILHYLLFPTSIYLSCFVPWRILAMCLFMAPSPLCASGKCYCTFSLDDDVNAP